MNVRIGSCPRIRANATGGRTAIRVVTSGSTSRQPDTEHSSSQFLVRASRRHRRVACAGTRIETVASNVARGSATTVEWSPTERYAELTTSDRRRYSWLCHSVRRIAVTTVWLSLGSFSSAELVDSSREQPPNDAQTLISRRSGFPPHSRGEGGQSVMT